MTVQAGTEISLELMVGEFEEQACESVSHGDMPQVHEGPASHYAKVVCPDCGYNAVKSYCQPFVNHIGRGGLLMCFCGTVHYANEVITILAPITK